MNREQKITTCARCHRPLAEPGRKPVREHCHEVDGHECVLSANGYERGFVDGIDHAKKHAQKAVRQ